MTGEILMAGVPHAGKTTYLALLYLAITRAQFASISLGGYSDDREYLNGLVRRLFTCERATHTETGRTDGLRLSVTLPDDGEALLVIPDLSGETWLDVVSERTWSVDLRDRVSSGSGACVFINVADFTEDPAIAQGVRADAAIGLAQGGGTTEASERGQSAQVQLVDLIQVLAESPTRSPRKISLVLSAFDLVDGLTPDEWMEMSAPLLLQYLESNSSWLHVETFGLSAQGGRFEDDEERAELLERDPLERASIVLRDGTPTDFDQPVLWVMAGA